MRGSHAELKIVRVEQRERSLLLDGEFENTGVKSPLSTGVKPSLTPYLRYM